MIFSPTRSEKQREERQRQEHSPAGKRSSDKTTATAPMNETGASPIKSSRERRRLFGKSKREDSPLKEFPKERKDEKQQRRRSSGAFNIIRNSLFSNNKDVQAAGEETVDTPRNSVGVSGALQIIYPYGSDGDGLGSSERQTVSCFRPPSVSDLSSSTPSSVSDNSPRAPIHTRSPRPMLTGKKPKASALGQDLLSQESEGTESESWDPTLSQKLKIGQHKAATQYLGGTQPGTGIKSLPSRPSLEPTLSQKLLLGHKEIEKNIEERKAPRVATRSHSPKLDGHFEKTAYKNRHSTSPSARSTASSRHSSGTNSKYRRPAHSDSRSPVRHRENDKMRSRGRSGPRNHLSTPTRHRTVSKSSSKGSPDPPASLPVSHRGSSGGTPQKTSLSDSARTKKPHGNTEIEYRSGITRSRSGDDDLLQRSRPPRSNNRSASPTFSLTEGKRHNRSPGRQHTNNPRTYTSHSNVAQATDKLKERNTSSTDIHPPERKRSKSMDDSMSSVKDRTVSPARKYDRKKESNTNSPSNSRSPSRYSKEASELDIAKRNPSERVNTKGRSLSLDESLSNRRPTEKLNDTNPTANTRRKDSTRSDSSTRSKASGKSPTNRRSPNTVPTSQKSNRSSTSKSPLRGDDSLLASRQSFLSSDSRQFLRSASPSARQNKPGIISTSKYRTPRTPSGRLERAGVRLSPASRAGIDRLHDSAKTFRSPPVSKSKLAVPTLPKTPSSLSQSENIMSPNLTAGHYKAINKMAAKKFLSPLGEVLPEDPPGDISPTTRSKSKVSISREDLASSENMGDASSAARRDRTRELKSQLRNLEKMNASMRSKSPSILDRPPEKGSKDFIRRPPRQSKSQSGDRIVSGRGLAA